MAYSLGIDYGTESGRVVLLDLSSGKELAVHLVPYGHRVIDKILPDSDTELPADWALQHPQDYLEVLQKGIPAVLAEANVHGSKIIGLGIDFTSCTVLPTFQDGTPLCMTDEFKERPHAWPKLWKHHSAQRFADRLNEVAKQRSESFLPRYGGRISAEWYFPKLLEIFEEDREVFHASATFIEATDWVVWQLTGQLRRNSCTAGYKALRADDGSFPDATYFHEVVADFTLPEEMIGHEFFPVGTKAGMLSDEWATATGLTTDVAVAVGNVDAHVSVAGAGIDGPGSLVMVIGTSICHLTISSRQEFVDGMTGVVFDGVLPGYYGYEAGQAAVGDMLAWFVENALPSDYDERARQGDRTIFEVLEEEAASLQPGETGLIALDWLNGNRSVLGDANLTGVIVGLDLATKTHEIYRALLESIAFGTRRILENFAAKGIHFEELVACGGLSYKSPLLMQLYADVCGLPVTVRASNEVPARGAALFGAVAAGAKQGGYDQIEDAVKELAPPISKIYTPDVEASKHYHAQYRIYHELYQYFGKDHFDLMHELKQYRQNSRSTGGVMSHA